MTSTERPPGPRTGVVMASDLGSDWSAEAHLPKTAGPEIKIVVTRSAQDDGAVIVFIDTDFEPDGSDGSPGLRVLVNDAMVGDGRGLVLPGVWRDRDRPAGSVVTEIHLHQIAYTHEPEGTP